MSWGNNDLIKVGRLSFVSRGSIFLAGHPQGVYSYWME